ncbi:MAG: hypothetical protein KDJ17_02190 [Hyphomicrobiaceae bacterium]|nr:hypothetical protein [Hyphomicrobiaceae bacterium]
MRPGVGKIEVAPETGARFAAAMNLHWAALLAGALLMQMMWAQRAHSDELEMPYACSVEAGQVQLTPSPKALTYPIVSKHEETAFSDCHGAGSRAACSTAMVHRFQLSCGGVNVSWAQVAAAARTLGVDLPRGMPNGFAPVGALNARLVFPALARFSPHKERVVSETLSADSVVEHAPKRSNKGSPTPAADESWQTTITAEMRNEPSGDALRLGKVAGGLLAFLFAVGFVVARRNLAEQLADRAETLSASLPQTLRTCAMQVLNGIWLVIANRMSLRSKPAASQADHTALMNALAMATARLAEAELQVGSLPRTLLLRDVLQAELDQLRARVDEIGRSFDQRPMQKSAAQVRSVLRELERISRISQGAAQDTSAARGDMGGTQSAGATPFHARTGIRMPQSVQEAYQTLGINAEAAPNVAKKLVDALRMSWHPDFARDEEDRRVREARMKQINAAWDLIKNRREAAA